MSNTVINVNAKSTFVAYLLWFFFGGLALHKFYLREPITGIFYLGLFFVGDLLWLVGAGWLLHVPLAILLFIDIFVIPRRVRNVNNGDTKELFQQLQNR
jgi:TM2 domain-containing membrane protein YozV